MLPSVDRRPTSRMPLPAKAMRIGRVPDNDVVLSDLNVSRHHAELRKSPTGQYEIVDLGSHNGTFVNGQRVTKQVLTEQDLVSIGSSTFRLTGGELRQFVDDGNITFTAQELVVKAGSKVLLDHVSFPIPEKCLLGVIGPSGAGKSTLVSLLLRELLEGLGSDEQRDVAIFAARGLLNHKQVVRMAGRDSRQGGWRGCGEEGAGSCVHGEDDRGSCHGPASPPCVGPTPGCLPTLVRPGSLLRPRASGSFLPEELRDAPDQVRGDGL
jgi:pSer/pThr/pTyr-binding forkhead associated (FHA) protein